MSVQQVTYYIILILGAVLSQKEGDEGRPYEFGFTIDGQQHRHEKKDQNGIVQGEFGFITADGVYHVTVYATDENGNFKILSMRNIRISAPLDGSPATGPISPDAGKYLKSAEKQLGHKLPSPQPPSPQKELFQQHSQQLHDKPQALEIRTRKPDFFMFTTLPTIKPACAGCGYVTTEALAPGQKFQFHSSVLPHKVTGNQHSPQAGVQNDVELKLTPDNVPNRYVSKVEIHSPNIEPRINFVNNNAQNPEDTISQNLQQNSQYNQNSQNKQKMQYSQNINTENESFGMNIVPSGVNQQNIGEYPTIQEQPNFGARDYPTADVSSFGLNKHKFGNSFNQQQSQQYNYQGQHLSGVQGIKSTDANSLSDGAIGPNPLIKSKDEVSQIPPVTVSDHVIHVGGNNPMDIPIKDKYAGMVDGLPDGIEENDIKGILYKFHYTVGFHGHYEKGLSNGAKVGGYFVNGRDGISRVVTYVADENGYRPKFKFINLGLDSSDTPKAETEKNFGLKNFEFKWYPIR